MNNFTALIFAGTVLLAGLGFFLCRLAIKQQKLAKKIRIMEKKLAIKNQ